MSDKFINPSGFTENLPAEQIVEDGLKASFGVIAESFGYNHLETAAVEYLDTLASKGDISKEIYTIGRALDEENSGESERGLRFDLTVPFARYVAQHQGELTFPYRRYQIQKVWRGERPQKGRFREFYQADVDVVAEGKLAIEFDAEVALVMANILSRFELGDITMYINNRKFLSGLLEQYNINTLETIQAIDKLDKIGREAVVAKIAEESNVSTEALTPLFDLLTQTIPSTDVSAFLNAIPASNPILSEGITELQAVFAALSTAAVDGVKFVLSPSTARGLDYYTGTVYETTIDRFKAYGSICSGGRYADLASRFTNRSLPGVGMSIGLTRLMSIIKAEGLHSFETKTKSRVMLCLTDSTRLGDTLTLANALRAVSINVETNYRADVELGKQLNAAEAKGIPYAVVCHENDLYTVFNIRVRGDKHEVAGIPELLTLINPH